MLLNNEIKKINQSVKNKTIRREKKNERRKWQMERRLRVS